MDTVNLDEVRKKADEMGMVYATAEQIMGYESPSSDSVKQYESIPENGVLAQSDNGNLQEDLWQNGRKILFSVNSIK